MLLLWGWWWWGCSGTRGSGRECCLVLSEGDGDRKSLCKHRNRLDTQQSVFMGDVFFS